MSFKKHQLKYGSYRNAVEDADRAGQQIESLYERTVNEHKSHEAELGLLREINRAEKKEQKKRQAKQNKLKRLQDRLSGEIPDPVSTVTAHWTLESNRHPVTLYPPVTR